MRTKPKVPRSTPLAEAFSGRANSFGFLRLCLAFVVLLSHVWPLGLGVGNPFDLGTIAVAGFFVLSGLLITRSARRTSVGRYLWHRGLRIFPALWVNLMVTAVVVAPALWLHQHGTLRGLFPVAWSYQQANWWTGLRQAGIGGLLLDTPFGRLTGSDVFNGSLWTLSYELCCYLAVAALALFAAPLAAVRRARWLVLVGTAAGYGAILYDSLAGGHLTAHRALGPLPLLGWLDLYWLANFGFMFAFGALAELYRERFAINDALGGVALVVSGWAVATGTFFGPALPAFAYLIVWLGVRLPARLHRVGARNDYSYGFYIYAFLVQQLLAYAGLASLGVVAYTVGSAILALGCAWLSWHLVEKHALRLKNWPPTEWRPGRVPGVSEIGSGVPKSRTMP